MALAEAAPRGYTPFAAPLHPSSELHEFWTLWSEERFWACHECLEETWRAEQSARKWFYGGLINGAVAVFQHRRGNAVGAARQLTRAKVKLEPFLPVMDGVDLVAFLGGIDREIAPSLEQLTPRQRADLSKVESLVKQRIAGPGDREDI